MERVERTNGRRILHRVQPNHVLPVYQWDGLAWFGTPPLALVLPVVEHVGEVIYTGPRDPSPRPVPAPTVYGHRTIWHVKLRFCYDPRGVSRDTARWLVEMNERQVNELVWDGVITTLQQVVARFRLAEIGQARIQQRVAQATAQRAADRLEQIGVILLTPTGLVVRQVDLPQRYVDALDYCGSRQVLVTDGSRYDTTELESARTDEIVRNLLRQDGPPWPQLTLPPEAL